MALTPKNKKHELQIKAGIEGRKKGHKFENILSNEINNLKFSIIKPYPDSNQHLYTGNPAIHILQYIATNKNKAIIGCKAYWLGGLATSGEGDALYDSAGNLIKSSKSDVLLKIKFNTSETEIVGVSVKTCNAKNPTNDQMFFTTATAFCNLLRSNNIYVSNEAQQGLQMFCGDEGFRPIDLMTPTQLGTRLSDPNRYFWEELPSCSQNNWNDIFSLHQDDITLLLFQKAYKNDPFPPTYLLHQTKKYDDFNNCEIAIFEMNEIVKCSKDFSDFTLKKYSIHKGHFKNDPHTHLAPRFGFIQFQRAGNKQHPTQLQFNLKAGYFYKI